MKLPHLWAAALAIFAGAAAAGFADPLDTPAVESRLAARSAVNGLAQAGPRIVAAGSRGHILYSDDAGRNWKQAQVPLRSDLTALSFADAQHGWAVGHDGVVLASRDGGLSWTRQLDGRALGPLLHDYYTQRAPDELDAQRRATLIEDAQRMTEAGPDQPFLDVWFEDAQHGFVVGAFNLILETTDGGASWTPWLHRTDNPRNLHLYAIRRAGGELYVAGEQGLLMKLDRGTGQFRALELPYHGTLFGVVGDAGGVTAYGLRGNAWRSRDGSGGWERVDTGVQVSLTAAAHDAAGRTLLASQTGHLLALGSEASASPISTGVRVPASALLALPDGSLIIGGPGGLQRLPAAQDKDKDKEQP